MTPDDSPIGEQRLVAARRETAWHGNAFEELRFARPRVDFFDEAFDELGHGAI
jgi:hypothetical protein